MNGRAATPERVAAIAAGQAKRDRARLAAAQAEILALQGRVTALERGVWRSALGPASRLAGALRRIVRAGPVPPPACQSPPPAAQARGRALVIDHQWPQPDRDSGSVDIVNLVQALQRLGFDTLLAAAEQHDGPQPARDRLAAMGVPCLQPDAAPSVDAYIGRDGASLDLCVLCRVYCGGAYLEQVQQHCRAARLIFNTVDLNYLREERKARLLQDAKLLSLIGELRAREEHVIRSCDATLVVSQAEAAMLDAAMPGSLVVQVPLARALHPPVAPFAERRGIGFVGGFAHSPNVDAVRMFLAETWPLVRQRLPDCTLSIAGAGAPPDLLEGADGAVTLLGHVPDLAPWFESLRLTVAPLRFGAGAKGKVASSLAAGVPCVVSPVAAEGMELTANDGIVVASGPDDFAAAIARVHEDAEAWPQLSAGGLAYASDRLSLGVLQRLLDDTLRRIGL